MTPTGYGGCQVSWGLPGDVPISGDYDADGKSEIAVVRPSSMIWYIRSTVDGSNVAVQFGLPGDKPDEGDFNYDGISDISVYRPTEDKFYARYYNRTTGAVTVSSVAMYNAGYRTYGATTEFPASANYNTSNANPELSYFTRYYGGVGDPRVGWAWYYQPSNYSGGLVFQYDDWTSIPVVGNYAGAGSGFDYVKWHPSDGNWTVYTNPGGPVGSLPGSVTQGGLNGDVPVSGDYDGDGIADLAVWRPSNGVWCIKPSTGNCANIAGTTPDAYGGCEKQWGVSGDVPVQ
jgi:hypothetical protein